MAAVEEGFLVGTVVTTMRADDLGRIGVANAAVGALVSAAGLSLQDWARERTRREERGLDPLAGRGYYETRLAVYLGVFCVLCGAISGVVGDALLPQSTQAPLAAIAVALRAAFAHFVATGRASELRDRNDKDRLLYESDDEAVVSDPRDVAHHKYRAIALGLMVLGPSIALLGARLDDVGGLSGAELAHLLAAPQAATTAAFSLAAVLLARRNSGVLYSGLASALASAWAHACVKAIVELARYYARHDGFFAAPAAWAALLGAPALIALKLRVVSDALNAFPAGLFMPLYQSLAIAANAACGIFVYDDFQLSDFTSFDIIAYTIGLVCAIAGVALTATDHLESLRVDDGDAIKTDPDAWEEQKDESAALLDDAPASELPAVHRGHARRRTPTPPSTPSSRGSAGGGASWDAAAAAAASSSSTITAGLSRSDAPCIDDDPSDML